MLAAVPFSSKPNARFRNILDDIYLAPNPFILVSVLVPLETTLISGHIVGAGDVHVNHCEANHRLISKYPVEAWFSKSGRR
jgi:hypothetical protein